MQEFLSLLSAWFLHLDVHLSALVAAYGPWIYLLLFAVIFVETGVVIMPFLPGDSLLFIAGALAAKGLFDPWLLFFLLLIAAITGDALNFSIGTYVRRKAIDTSRIPFLKAEHIELTHQFFVRHGGKTIILARFVPIVRTLAPFVAALGSMNPRTFFTYNVVGGLIWVGSLLLAGYVFGNIPWVSDNLTAVVMLIVLLSIMPAIIAWLKTLGKRSGSKA
ncbi:MAG: VTT domain-containing protein [Duganella sp.]